MGSKRALDGLMAFRPYQYDSAYICVMEILWNLEGALHGMMAFLQIPRMMVTACMLSVEFEGS